MEKLMTINAGGNPLEVHQTKSGARVMRELHEDGSLSVISHKQVREDYHNPSIEKPATPTRDVIGRTDGVSGFASMSSSADEKIAQNIAAREAAQASEAEEKAAALEAEAAKIRKDARREARRNSTEVSLLNDTAELEIYGSKGRTWYGADGSVIASPQKPIKGRIAEIKDELRFGVLPGDSSVLENASDSAQERADKYEANINTLLEDGFELCQAKLIMDLREADEAHMSSVLAEFVSNGMNPNEAAQKVVALYAKKDEKRVDIIRDQDVMSEDEYTAYLDQKNTPTTPSSGVNRNWDAPNADDIRSGTNPRPNLENINDLDDLDNDSDDADNSWDGTGVNPNWSAPVEGTGHLLNDDNDPRINLIGSTPPPPSAEDFISDVETDLAKKEELALKAFNDFSEAIARQTRVAFGLRKSSRNKHVKETEAAYISTRNIAEQSRVERLRREGATEEEIQASVMLRAAEEAMLLYTGASKAVQADSVAIATEKKSITENQIELSNTKVFGKFNAWFTRQSEAAKNDTNTRTRRVGARIAQIGALGTIGAAASAASILAAPFLAASVGAGAAGAGLFGYKVMKGNAISKISRDANAQSLAERNNTEGLESTKTKIRESNGIPNTQLITEAAVAKAREVQRTNRRRVLGSIMMGGASGAIVGAAVEALGVRNISSGLPSARIPESVRGTANSASDWISGKFNGARELVTGDNTPGPNASIPVNNGTGETTYSIANQTVAAPLEKAIGSVEARTINLDFFADRNNGITQELKQTLFESGGIPEDKLTGVNLINAVDKYVETKGPDEIFEGITPYVMSDGRIGFSDTGNGSWNKDFIKFAVDFLAEQE